MGATGNNNLDLTFFTNDENGSLLERFRRVLKTTRYFDVLVGYFRASGFFNLYQSLENVEKIRVIVGLKLDEHTWDIYRHAREGAPLFHRSKSQVRDQYKAELRNEVQATDDNYETDTGIRKFVEFILSGKLEMKVYPNQPIHAKVYIMRKPEGDEDFGRVITGSSNFSFSGLHENLEFNVELKQGYDVRFALDKFEELWAQAIDITEDFVSTVQHDTWVNDTITPYQLYLKFLYEYFKPDLSYDYDLMRDRYPEGFMDLEYQCQAVVNALRIIEEHGGVFISDVVGLGKTYISAMIAGQLEGHTLVIASPALLDENNPGSWPNVMRDFSVQATFESIGKLDSIDANRLRRVKNVIIDEAHAFRTETNKTYARLATICHGKKVILVTATPYNNRPSDLLAQIRIFQKGKQSTIPGLPNIDAFFGRLEKLIDPGLREENFEEYIRQTKEIARQIRGKVLKHLMVRRTRTEIVNFFGDDLTKQGLRFPEVNPPQPLYYRMNAEESRVFDLTLSLLQNDFRYTRYAPMLYYRGTITEMERQSQRNMMRFMKILLVKRLESSFHAFRKSLDRFIRSYEFFIKLYDEGDVYFSRKHLHKVFDLIEAGDDEGVEKLLAEGKAEKISADMFDPALRSALAADLDTLIRIRTDWEGINRDPKLQEFIHQLKSDPVLKENKLIVFTESKETAEYLKQNLEPHEPGKILMFTGSSDHELRREVIYNFDNKSKERSDQFRILITTEVLAEGVNLHRSNVVVNYDIPWNPTRMMQRVGRINRVDTPFDTIYTYNFFPSEEGNDAIRLQQIAMTKINAFITLLGADAKLLTEMEEIEQHELFNKLNSKSSLEGEEEDSPLVYLKEIRDIMENDPALFNKIAALPVKAKSSVDRGDKTSGVFSFIKKGSLEKFCFCGHDMRTGELDFQEAAALLKAEPDTPRASCDLEKFYLMIGANLAGFRETLAKENDDERGTTNMSIYSKLQRQVKFLLGAFEALPGPDREFLEMLLFRLREGALPKQTATVAYKEVAAALEQNDLKGAIKILLRSVPSTLLHDHVADDIMKGKESEEVILSLNLSGN